MILDEILVILKNSGKNRAYTENNITYTYQEFYKYVCNIYNYLKTNNKAKKDVIVYGSKEVYMKASFLACSFAGITYIPIDKSVPDDRVNSIIEQLKPYCIIGDFKYKDCINISKNQINEIMNCDNYEEINEIYLKPEDTHYIIFTSGSTGVPKGVEVLYRNLDSCVKWLQEITNIEKGVILNQAIYSFDLSIADVYLSLISGSEHYILGDATSFNFKETFEKMKKSNATIGVFTPSYLDLMLLDKSFNKELLPNLKTIIFCGEKLFRTTVDKLNERFNELRIINCYGPTECTFAVTSIDVTKRILEKGDIPIGKPKKNVEIKIVDENRKELQEGQIGEILILGESVAKGYVKEQQNNPFIIFNGKKAYLTGDLGFLKNGLLYCIGRKDSQIKLKGYRIELSDIEKNFYNLNYIEKVKVIPQVDKNNIIIKLIAYVMLKTNIKKDSIDIKNDLAKKIPAYMIPNIRILEEFPLNNNGKIDVQELRRITNGRQNN